MIGTAFKEPTHITEFSVAAGYNPKAGDIVYLGANGVSTQANASGSAIGVVASLPTPVKEPIQTIAVYIWGEIRVATQSGNIGDSAAGFIITQRLGSEDVVMVSQSIN